MIRYLDYTQLSLLNMPVSTLMIVFMIISVIGALIAIGGTVYASRHNRKDKSQRMIIAYFGSAMSIIGVIGTILLQ